MAVAAAVLVAGCGDRHRAAPRGDTAGDRLEAAAVARGVVADPARVDATGLYAAGEDRLCVVPRAAGAAGYRIGMLVRYDEAQGCTARGTAERTGDRLDVELGGGAGECRFAARFEGDRIVLPADLPPACDRVCTGRASLAALAVERLSDGAAEAAAQRDAGGHPLCG